MMTDGPRSLRLFVAVELPPEVRQALGDVAAELKARGLERLRWVRPEGIHLTLKFLGETPAERRPAIEDALSAAAEGVAPHEVTLGRLGKFGSRQSPRVLWVDVAGDTEALETLQARVDARIAPLGFQAEQRAFAAHLTLARVPQELARTLAGPLAEAIEAVRVPPLPIPVREVSLMRSELRREGAAYTRLCAIELGRR
jgi:2'-5' RNA ligase